MPDKEGWDNYRIFILETLKRIDTTLASINTQLQQHSTDIKLQALKWGLLGGLLPALAAVATIYRLFKP